jgi:ABC-type multidrug transport system fused ATPase/permease subunit
VFDSTIVQFSSYSGEELSSLSNVVIFVIFSIVYVGSSCILLKSVKNIVSNYNYKPAPHGLRYLQGIMIGTLISTTAIILAIICQMLLVDRYSIVLLEIQTYTCHFIPFAFVSFLIYLLGLWLKSKRSILVMLYIGAFSSYCANLIVTFIYLESYFTIFSSVLPDVSAYPITSYVVNLPGMPLTELLSTIFDILSLLSFLIMWVATAIFLSQYRFRMGKVKYFTLISIPLIYYIFPFQNYFGDQLLPLLQSSPVSFSIVFILVFSATKQVGAVLFSLSFWFASSLVYDDRIRKSLLISSIGMAILFNCIALSPLQYRVFPPYGLITEAFLPLGSYLLVIGLYTSAKHLARDASMRKWIYNGAQTQLSILKEIGVSQMERDLEKQLKITHSKASSIIDEPQLELEDEDFKKILHDVLTELYYSKK